MEVVAGFSIVLSSGLMAGNRLGNWLLLILLLAAGVGVLMIPLVRASIREGRQTQIVLIAGGLLLALLAAVLTGRTLVAGFFTAVFVGVAYWRGLASASEDPGHAEVMWAFGRGLIIFAAGIVWMISRQLIYQPAYWHLLALLGIAYVVLAMLALVLSRVESTREPGAGAAVALAVAFQLLILLLLGGAGILVFSHNLGAILYNITRPLWDLIGFVGEHVWAFLISPLIWALQFLQAHYHPPNTHQPPNPHFGNHCVPAGEPNPHHLRTCPPQRRLHAPKPNQIVTTILGLTFGTLVVASVLYVIWRVVPRLIPERTPPPYQERRRFLSPREILVILLAWIRSLLGRASRAAATAAEGTRRRVLGPQYPDDPVRQVYARLLHRAEAVGLPRPPAVTPVEYQARLAARWPSGQDAFAAITQAYVLRRYGDVPFAGEQITALQEQWHVVRKLMRQEVRTGTGAQSEVTVGAEVPVRPMGWRGRLVSLATQQNLFRSLVMDVAASTFGLAVWVGLFIFGLVLFIWIVTLVHGH